MLSELRYRLADLADAARAHPARAAAVLLVAAAVVVGVVMATGGGDGTGPDAVGPEQVLPALASTTTLAEPPPRETLGCDAEVAVVFSMPVPELVALAETDPAAAEAAVSAAIPRVTEVSEGCADTFTSALDELDGVLPDSESVNAIRTSRPV